jgi:hypothetical protein
MKAQWAFIVALLCLLTGCASSREDWPGERQVEGVRVEGKSDEVLRGLSAHMQGLQRFEAQISLSTDQQEAGSNLKIKTAHQLAVAKPDRFALLSTGCAFSTTVEVYGSETRVPIQSLTINTCDLECEHLSTTIVCDGKKMYLRSMELEEGGVGDAPDDLSGLMFLYDIAPLMAHDAVINDLLEALLAEDPYRALVGVTGTWSYLGTEEIEGVECHELLYAFPKDNRWHVFISTGEAPVVTEVRVTWPAQPGKNPARCTHSAVFTDWRLDADIPESMFAIPPQGRSGKN